MEAEKKTSPHWRTYRFCSKLFQSSSRKNSTPTERGKMSHESIHPSDCREPSLSACQWTAMLPGQVSMPHRASATLRQSIATRTECQSTVCWRRSMEKKSSSGTGAVGGSCAGSWQCIRSARDRPSASARGSSVLMSGRPTPVSLN